MKYEKLEKQLIEHCAPTLAGIKSANLFSYFYGDEGLARTELKEVNTLLNERGVYVEEMLWREKSVLIYVYRKNHLQKELSQPEVMELLMKYGYKNAELEDCIHHLKGRLYNYTCFPHEIGLFLGYPIEDVKGFIENGGRNCKSCGLWKVYCNEAEKEKLFHKLKRCTEVYTQVFSEGRSLVQMTISA